MGDELGSVKGRGGEESSLQLASVYPELTAQLILLVFKNLTDTIP